jgi:hypothetical protein
MRLGAIFLPRLTMNAPASSEFLEFQRRVVQEEELFARLAQVTDPAAFATLAVQLGAERGFSFGAEEVRGALLAARRTWMERHIA